jgi:hypothetical protein
MSVTTVQQQVTIKGNGNILDGVTMIQANAISISCSQSSQQFNDFQNNMVAAIKQSAANTDASLNIAGKSNSSSDTELTQKIKTDISMQNIQNIVSTTNQQQGLSVTGNNNIIRNFTQKQTMDLLASNIQQSLASSKTIGSIAAQLDQNSTNVTKNQLSDIISSVFSGLTSMTGLIVIVLIVLIIAVVLLGPTLIKAFFGDKSENIDEAAQKTAPGSLEVSGGGSGKMSDILTIIASA